MGGGLGDRALGLAQGSIAGLGSLSERAAERGDQEPVGLLVEGERRGLAGAAYNPARGGRLHAGPQAGGGFRVRAEIPVQALS